MSEKQTFDKLRRCTLDEMTDKLSNIKKLSPMFMFGTVVHERTDLFPELSYNLEVIKTLESNGWTVEDFYLATEKKYITNIVDRYNTEIQFPQELLDRALRSFPDAKFTHAKIELE